MNLLRDLFYALLPPVTVLFLQFTRMGLFPHATEWDAFAHVLGGAAIAWSAHILWVRWQERKIIPQKTPAWIAAWCVFGAVLFAGITWELFEFVMEQQTGWIFQPSIADTMCDFVMDMLGGALFALATWNERA